MKIRVSFDKASSGRSSDECENFDDELKPLLDAYAWNQKKGEAVFDLLAELADGDHECEVACDAKGVSCTAVAAQSRRLLLVANLTESAVPFELDAGAYQPESFRIIDTNRTNVAVPMPANLPPLSILLITFGR